MEKTSITEGIALGATMAPAYYADPTIGLCLAVYADRERIDIRKVWPILFAETPRDSWLHRWAPIRLGMAIANAEYSGIDRARIIAEIKRIENGESV